MYVVDRIYWVGLSQFSVRIQFRGVPKSQVVKSSQVKLLDWFLFPSQVKSNDLTGYVFQLKSSQLT